MSDATTTQALVQRVRDGDMGALNELYNRYMPRTLAAVRARLGAELRGKVESWDIVQDAMLASLRTVRQFEHDGEGAFINWLAKIVENRVRDEIDFHRAAKRDHRREQSLRQTRSDDSSIPLDIPDRSGAPSPSQILMLSEDITRLEAAMDRLPAESRELIVATRIEGRAFTDIVREFGKSPDAVRMQVNRAMAALTNAFQQLEAEDDTP